MAISHSFPGVHNPLPSASRTASTNSPEFPLPAGNAGVVVEMEVTVDGGGTETLRLILQRKTPAGTFVDYVAGTARDLAANDVTYLTAYPGALDAPEGTINDAKQTIVPPGSYRIRVVHSAAGAWTYRVDVTPV